MSEEIIRATFEYVKGALAGQEVAHDFWHIQRVWQAAKLICKEEGGDALVIELAALLHDIADYKFHGGDEEIGPKTAKEWLVKIGTAASIADQVADIVSQVSFKGAANTEKLFSLEQAIVQDADRLDAMGAIGIARTFAFGGHFKRELFNPEIYPQLEMQAKEYKKNQSSTINHFFEKLLLLKGRMLTATGKKLAEERHLVMLNFLGAFFEEWFGAGEVPEEWREKLEKARG